jgi:hypothetical protein
VHTSDPSRLCGRRGSVIHHAQTDRQQQSLDLLGPFSDELQSLPVWAMTPASLLCVRILSYNCVTVQTDLYVTDKAVLRQQRRAAMPEVVAVEQNRAWLIAHRNLSLIQRRTKVAQLGIHLRTQPAERQSVRYASSLSGTWVGSSVQRNHVQASQAG